MDKIESQFQPYWELFKKANQNFSYVVTSRYRPESKGSYHAIEGMAMDITLRSGSDYAALSKYEDLFLFLYANGWKGGVGIDNTVSNKNVHIHLDARNLDGKSRYFFIEDDKVHKIPFNGDPQQLVAWRNEVDLKVIKKN